MRYVTLILILLITHVNIRSQNQQQMPNVWAENWLSAKINFRINNKWDFSFKEQLRLTPIYDIYERNYSEFQIEKFSKRNFNWGISYRHVIRNNGMESSMRQYNRNTCFFTQKWSMGNENRLSYKYRVQYQRQRERLPNTNKHVSELRKYWRIKTDLSYNIKNWKLDPKIGIEFFFRGSNHPTDQYNKYRITIGTKKKLNKNQSITIKYMFEKQRKSWNPEVIHVLGIQYNYDLKHQTKNYIDKNNED